MKAATEMFWKKICSYKQLFWKLPGEIFSQNPWKISLKKFVFSKVAQSPSQTFLPKNELGKKQFSHIFLSGKNLRERDWRLSACSFTKNNLLHRYFSRMLIANFRTPIFHNTSQVAASAEAYSGPCLISKKELFCEYN